MHTYIHAYIRYRYTGITYSITNHIITYIHNFRTLPQFVARIGARAGFNMIFATRFGLLVRTRVLNTGFRVAGLYDTFGGASTPLYFFSSKGAERFCSESTKKLKTDGSLERPRKKTSRPRPEAHLFRAGQKKREHVLFSIVSEPRATPWSGKSTCCWTLLETRNLKLACGSTAEHIFENGFVYDFASRVGSQTKSIVGLLVRARSYFARWTDGHLLFKLAPE